MGGQKDRSKRPRAGLGHAARSRAARLGVKADGDVAVRYWAHNGNEYRIDVSRMQQTKFASGSRRTVLRECLDGFGVAWSFESSRRRKHSSESVSSPKADQCAVYVQYPTEVCAVLEHRYRTFCVTEDAKAEDPKSTQAAEDTVKKLNNGSLRAIFGLNVAETSTSTEKSTEISATSGDDSDKCCSKPTQHDEGAPVSNSRRSKMKIAQRLAARVSTGEPALAECLFERVLQTRWPAQEVAAAVRWLHRRGLRCQAEHCRKAALLHGSIAVLRVLLVEAQVDVRGLELLIKAPAAAARGRVAAERGDASGWVQRCKAAIKVLFARGAMVGAAGTPSKLLRRLEEDGEVFFRKRVLATLCQSLPDVLLGHIGDFASLTAPFAWRDFPWGSQ